MPAVINRRVDVLNFGRSLSSLCILIQCQFLFALILTVGQARYLPAQIGEICKKHRWDPHQAGKEISRKCNQVRWVGIVWLEIAVLGEHECNIENLVYETQNANERLLLFE